MWATQKPGQPKKEGSKEKRTLAGSQRGLGVVRYSHSVLGMRGTLVVPRILFYFLKLLQRLATVPPPQSAGCSRGSCDLTLPHFCRLALLVLVLYSVLTLWSSFSGWSLGEIQDLLQELEHISHFLGARYAPGSVLDTSLVFGTPLHPQIKP